MEVNMPYTILGDLQTLILGNTVICSNPCCILTLNCEVLLMGVMEVTNLEANSTLFKLPESMTPHDQIILPVYVENSDGMTIQQLLINKDGTASLKISLINSVVYVNGLTFNVADRYYNSDIGNNISQGTSPLR